MTVQKIKLLTFNDYDYEDNTGEFLPCTERPYMVQMFGLNTTG